MYHQELNKSSSSIDKIPSCTGNNNDKNKVTSRAFNTRKKEYFRNVKTGAKVPWIANHAWSHNHAIDFENAFINDKLR